MPQRLLSGQTQPGRRGGSRSRTFALRTPRVWGAATARGTARRGGLAAPHTPQSASPALLRPSAAARWAPGSRSHPQPLAPGAGLPPRSRAPWAGPRGAPGSSQVSLGTERPQSKRGKEKAKEGQGPGACGLAWRWGGVDTKRAGKGPGVARGLRARPPLAGPLPSPSRAPSSLSVQFLSPPLGPSPLRRGAQSWGLRERREGKREGNGRGGGERRTIPPKAGVEFQLRTLGPNCTPPPGPPPRRPLLPDVAAALPWLGPLAPGSLLLPATPPLSPASPAPLSLPFISPTSVFPVGGSALLPPSWGPPRSGSSPLAWPLQGWQG